jgi:Na+-transporting NADH:ubiquinone oxidoreductase subunit A
VLEYESFEKGDPSVMGYEKVKENLLNSGLWPAIKQRPYNIIANPNDKPKAIFISAFDTAPLAPDYDFLVKGCEKEFQAGIDALARLTDGIIHISVDSAYPPNTVFTNAKGVHIQRFRGPHPAEMLGLKFTTLIRSIKEKSCGQLLLRML